MKRLAGAGDRFAEESIAITAENIRRLRDKPGVSGVHIMPLGWRKWQCLRSDREGTMKLLTSRALARATNLDIPGGVVIAEALMQIFRYNKLNRIYSSDL
ncbi:MAG: hypothetical protein MZV63_52450 [Marinilabiliales bacterium]|nr:hypothetical protein [Marinilabiliales bacterium]